ncbi:hypothetical protein BOQ23_10955 [Listeria monocytogenes]|nr:hypothetical protein [Listeria monocytogenes]
MYVKGRIICAFVLTVVVLCSVLILLIIKISIWKEEPLNLSAAKEIECLGSCKINNTNQKIHFFSLKKNLFVGKDGTDRILNKNGEKAVDEPIFIVILDEDKVIMNND